MKNIKYTTEMVSCCPLCQHEEFLISGNNEKFICAQCGFTTNQLSQVQVALPHGKTKINRYIHATQETVH